MSVPDDHGIRAYLVDDESLAIERLSRLLQGFPEIRVAGSSTNPAHALLELTGTLGNSVDVLFLDIQMPEMNGFELLSRLQLQPFVIFTTAYDEYALKAFEVNSIDYLLKPIEEQQLERAVRKLQRLMPQAKAEWQERPEFGALLQQLSASLRGKPADYPRRIATRLGERITFLDLANVTHFIAQDKLTYAVCNGKEHCVDQTITELERRLDPANFFRIHRSLLVNVDWIQHMNAYFAGRVVVTLKDAQHTQLTVARDRVRPLKSRMGLSPEG